MTFIFDYCDSEKILEDVVQPNHHKGCRRNNSEELSMVLSRYHLRNILGGSVDPKYIGKIP